jgi:hypothetical protein
MAVAVALSLLGVAPSGASAVVIGVGDQSPAMFSSPAFLGLHVHEARINVAWNVAVARSERGDLAGLATWLGAAQAAGVTPLVSFNGNGNYTPSVAEYTAAVRAFMRRFPAVRRFTAWNEPDWIYRPISHNPLLAASFFNALVRNCRGCIVLAGDLYLAAPQLRPWLRSYIKGLRYRPAGWALHNYHDVRTHTTAQLTTLLSLTSGPVWLDEISGVERRGHWQYGNQSPAAAGRDEQFLVSLARRFPRVSRIYHYQWESVPSAGWDSGLLGADGRPRPAYYALASAVR